MSIAEHPSRILSACNRIVEILHVEFNDLTPPDKHYVMSILADTYIAATQREFNNSHGR